MLHRMNLIPRYNWDFDLKQLVKSVSYIIGSSNSDNNYIREIFKNEPIYSTSGRTSLYIILKSLGLKKGSGIGVPLFCCPVVFEAISEAHLKPVFIDIDESDYTLDIIDLEKKKNNLSALVVVHMFGNVAKLDEISNLCKNIPIIEDCAQSLFSRYKNTYTGLVSSISFFSFRTGKYISAGEGSVIFCQDLILHSKIRESVEELRDWKFFEEILYSILTYVKSLLYKRPFYGTVGYPLGKLLDKKLNLTAKSGLSLKKIAKSHKNIINDRIDNFISSIELQRENSLYYLKKLNLKNADFIHEQNDSYYNYYQFPLKFKNKQQRDWMADYLFKYNIDTAKYLDEVLAIVKEQYHYAGDCPIAEKCSQNVLIIPNYYTLSKKDIDHIIKILDEGDKILSDL